LAGERRLVGVTMGDPCGIGPELVLRLLGHRGARKDARFVVFGNRAVLERVAGRLGLPLPRFQTVEDPPHWRRTAGPCIVDTTPCPARLALLGRATAEGGRASVRWIEQAINAAVAGHIEAIVTAPINKEAVLKGGASWPGHTEMLEALTGAERAVMMMVAGDLRAALVTTHAAISQIPKLITRRRVLETLRITERDLRRGFGIRRPRLCVCGLNPHAGEAGRFGDEEKRIIAPAVRQAAREGIRCEGPLPADVVFTRRMMPRYDAAVAMYHDQANIPVKLLGVEKGVNVTLGLPIIRTSPDHGTAYDIVRRGVADVRSMLEALRTATHMARCWRRHR